jgi:hypothetical protein
LKAQSLSDTLLLSALLASLLASAGCGLPSPASTNQPVPDGTPVTSFRLIDVNPASPHFNSSVGPLDYSGKVSGWYFGHAT